MASYLGDIERNTLPSIRRSGLLESGATRRITTFDDGVNIHRYRSGSPTSGMYLSDSPLQPRPPSPSQRRTIELQEQVKSFKDEMKKKDALIQQLVSMDVPKTTIRSSADTFRTDTVYMGDRHAVETARSELAALQVKNEKLQLQVAELRAELETKDIKMKEFKTLYETSKENESRLSVMLDSHRQQIIELEGKAGSYGAVVGRSEVTVAALQKQIREGQEKILDLEGRLRKYLQEREAAEIKCHTVEKKYEDIVTQITGVLHAETVTGYLPSVDEVLKRLIDLVQENALLKGKIVNLREALNSTELETKASRETIMRLVSEVGKEQKVTTRYTSEIDNLRMERDSALSSRHALEREIELLNERLEASQRALDASRTDLEMREHRLSELDREIRTNVYDAHSCQSQLNVFKEQLASILSSLDYSVEISEESIKHRISELVHTNRELVVKVEGLQDRVKTLTHELENQYELHKTASHRARKAENDLVGVEERLRSAEGELNAGDVLRDGLRSDKEKYLRCLQKIGETMKMDRISIDLGMDMTVEALIARAEQLVRMEKDALADKSTHIYNLQRKVKSMKEQLESKDLHIDLMRKKMTSLEEKILCKTEIEKERDNETYRVRKLEKIIEKYKLQIHDLRHEVTNLKAQLLGSSEIKIRTMEQRKEIEEMSAQIEELEQLKARQNHKISQLKDEVHCRDNESKEKRVVADNAVHALSSELRTTKNALAAIQNREKQLLDFRNVVSRMLGLDMSTLAVPDYEIISRLEKLIQAHHNHAFTTLSMEEALADMEDGILSGYEDYCKTLSSSESANIKRSRERARRKAARRRARSASPVRRDLRVY